MLRLSILALVVLGGCVSDAEEPPATIEIKTTGHWRTDDRTTVEPTTISPEAERDVCGLASQLAADDVCSLMCDPGAMADALIAEGMRPGACYQLRCLLPDSSTVQVGVCLAPPP